MSTPVQLLGIEHFSGCALVPWGESTGAEDIPGSWGCPKPLVRASSGKRPVMNRGSRVLLTLPDWPWPPDRGKRVRTHLALQSIAQDFDVDVLILHDAGDPGSTPPSLPPVRSIEAFPLQLRPKPLAATESMVHRWPWQVSVRDRTEVASWIARSGPWEAVWFGGVPHWLWFSGLIRPGTPVAVDMDDVESEKLRAELAVRRFEGGASALKKLQRRIELRWWERIERKVCSSVEAVVVCSELDQQRLSARTRPGADCPVTTVPNTYPPPAESTGHGDPHGPILFLANFDYGPNQDACRWLLDHIAPKILAKNPTARLQLVGRDTQGFLGTLVSLPDQVEVVGTVPEVAPYLNSASLSVAPIRLGGGTRIKIIESMAYGVPVVSTPLGCEGLGVVDGRQVLEADSARDFADACCLLLSDSAARDRLTHHGLEHYRRHFRPEAAESAINGIMAQL